MLPQLDYTTYSSQLFWLVVNFSLLYFVISFFIIPSLDRVLKKRSNIVEQNNEKAKENRNKTTLEQEKYDLAIAKSKSLAQDIIQDNSVALEEYKSKLYRKLKGEINKLNNDHNQEFAEFKSKIKSDLVNEVVNLISLYYLEITRQVISNDEIIHELKEEMGL